MRKPYRPPVHHPRCVSAGMKLCYNSRESAERMLAHIIVHGSSRQVPRRAYECQFCGKWHLTAQELRRVGSPVRSYPDAITNPLGPPTVGGTELSAET